MFNMFMLAVRSFVFLYKIGDGDKEYWSKRWSLSYSSNIAHMNRMSLKCLLWLFYYLSLFQSPHFEVNYAKYFTLVDFQTKWMADLSISMSVNIISPKHDQK